MIFLKLLPLLVAVLPVEILASPLQDEGYTYKAFYTNLNWWRSREFCVGQGGDLAYHGMRTEAERMATMQKFDIPTNSSFWIGANDRYREGEWRYVDGTRVNVNNFGWRGGRPGASDRDLDFAALVPGSYQVRDMHRFQDTPFICEYPPPGIVTTVYFIHMRFDAGLSWQDSDAECRQRGATLAYTGLEDRHFSRNLFKGIGHNSVRGQLHVGWRKTDRDNEVLWTDLTGKEVELATRDLAEKADPDANCSVVKPNGDIREWKCHALSWSLCQKNI